MKKLILLAVMAMIYVCGLAQGVNNTSVVIQKVDSSQNAKILKIDKSLYSFYKQNQTSQVLSILGAVIFVASATLTKDPDVMKPGMIVGGGLMAVGYVVYINSFKHLDLKREKKVNYNVYELR